GLADGRVAKTHRRCYGLGVLWLRAVETVESLDDLPATRREGVEEGVDGGPALDGREPRSGARVGGDLRGGGRRLTGGGVVPADVLTVEQEPDGVERGGVDALGGGGLSGEVTAGAPGVTVELAEGGQDAGGRLAGERRGGRGAVLGGLLSHVVTGAARESLDKRGGGPVDDGLGRFIEDLDAVLAGVVAVVSGVDAVLGGQTLDEWFVAVEKFDDRRRVVGADDAVGQGFVGDR